MTGSPMHCARPTYVRQLMHGLLSCYPEHFSFDGQVEPNRRGVDEGEQETPLSC